MHIYVPHGACVPHKDCSSGVWLGLLDAESSVRLCRDSNYLTKVMKMVAGVRVGGEGWGEGASRQRCSPGCQAPVGANPGKREIRGGHGV